VRRMVAIPVLSKVRFFCRLDAGSHGLQASSSGHGDLEDDSLQFGCWPALNLCGSCSWEWNHGDSLSAAVQDGRRSTAPTLVVGFSSSRPTFAGEIKPPGF
jgi:hypothetical protein